MGYQRHRDERANCSTRTARCIVPCGNRRNKTVNSSIQALIEIVSTFGKLLPDREDLYLMNSR
jgi:hypothetical protein